MDEKPLGDPIEELRALVKQCADSEAYMIFIARLVPGDLPGEKKIQFDYRRYHLTLDDAAVSVRKLREEVLREIKGELNAAN